MPEAWSAVTVEPPPGPQNMPAHLTVQVAELMISSGLQVPAGWVPPGVIVEQSKSDCFIHCQPPQRSAVGASVFEAGAASTSSPGGTGSLGSVQAMRVRPRAKAIQVNFFMVVLRDCRLRGRLEKVP